MQLGYKQGDSMTQKTQNLQIIASTFFMFLFWLPPPRQNIDKYEEHLTGNKRLNSHKNGEPSIKLLEP